jgi:hypothetical protein
MAPGQAQRSALFSGGSKRKQTANNMYNAAYADCMAGRVR